MCKKLNEKLDNKQAIKRPKIKKYLKLMNSLQVYSLLVIVL